jgi:hypothetical protein
VTASLHSQDEAYDVTGETPVVPSDQDARQPDAPPPNSGGFLTRLRSGDLDLRNTWQIAVGALLLPLGVAAIVLGWSGAAHGRVDQQQIPYLISGGILGLACVMVGCFFFWAHWLYRIYDQADLHHQVARREQADMIRALIDALERRAPGDGDATDGHASRAPRNGRQHRGSAASGNGAAPAFVATPNGTNFHAPTCPIVAHRLGSLREVSRDEAGDMRPCRICEPLGAAG